MDLPRGRWWDASDQEQHGALSAAGLSTTGYDAGAQVLLCALSGGADAWVDFGEAALPPAPWTVCAVVRAPLAAIDAETFVLGQ